MLNFDEVSFKYKDEDKDIVKKLSFSLKQGEFISMLGTSGCGKSTIFRLITGLENPSEGNIFLNGNNLKSKKNLIGYMPQKDLLLPWRNILENICLPLEISGVGKLQAKEKAEEFLKKFSLYEYKNKYPKDLSGGMKQRISFIRTLLTNSDLLLLDEPFSALDAITRISLQEWTLNQCSKLNKTILFITHDVEEAIFLSNKILLVSETPITSLKEIQIPLSYPRNRKMLENKEVLELKENLINKLRQKAIM